MTQHRLVRATLIGRLVMAAAASSCVALTVAGAQGTSPALGTLEAIRQGEAQRERGDVSGAIATLRRAALADTTSAPVRFRLAYALLAAGRTEEAIAQFREGLARDATYALGHRQLGYLYSAAGRPRLALASFSAADALHAMIGRDWYQTGIELAWLGRNGEAGAAFARAAAADTSLRALATAATEKLDGNGFLARHDAFVEAYAAPLYQTRFDIGIVDAIGRAGILLAANHSVTPYLSLRVSTDTRSEGGAFPQLFSDNTVIPAVGLRLRPFRSVLTVYGEAGAAIPAFTTGDRPTRPDLRAGAYYFGGWQHGRLSKSGSAPMSLHGEFYADASYYSRYADAITYLSYREQLRLLESRSRSVELYARLGVTADGKQLYYSNLLESAAGVVVYPVSSRRIALFAESLHGRYLLSAQPGTARTYGTLRLTTVVSAYRSHPARWR